ncbi:hypothetical protein SKP52_10070 [Sphingopyxis fribergensis]|uniref:Uncharacterized protein n=1 Tax=Sphingopyxis fribergensis TaxID=1515612 RepID=A0A0A7PFL8_9SPHN|nr:DUF6118 family protein [Sphingopyxis fribergensis]AJA08921.1 hypothetical protein SKP52_10070 [Sphingopyxis fribergensis]
MPEDELEIDDPATAAFRRLEGEVALMRRATEKLAAEKSEIRIPDYSLTLGEISNRLDAAEETLTTILGKPAMELTPEDMARRIDRVVQDARQSTEGWIRNSQDRYEDAIRGVLGVSATLRAAYQQRLHLWCAGGGGLLAGCLLWSILPGALARALPDRWQLPERMAAHVVGAPSVWDGGIQLMQAGSPEAYRAIAAAAEMRRDNREKIEGCEKAALKAKRPVNCTIRVGHPEI